MNSIPSKAKLKMSDSLSTLPVKEVNSQRPLISGSFNQESTRVRAIEKPQRETFTSLKESRLGKFYIQHVKRYSLLRAIAIWAWCSCYPLYVHIVASIRMRTDNRWRQLTKLSDYVEAYGIPVTRLADGALLKMSTPISLSGQDYLKLPHDDFHFPPIGVARVADGMIYGGTNLVLVNEQVICHDLYDFERDYTSEELHGRNVISAKKGIVRWLLHDETPEALDKAAIFVDACAGNYAHWLTEVLPRIALFCSEEKFSDIPIVINDGLHKNIMESLFLMVGPKREIITIPIGRAIRVNELWITSVTGYVPFERRNKKMQGHSHGVFSPYSFDTICKKVASLGAGEMSRKVWPEKIYLRRNSGIRKVANEKALESLLVNLGFLVIEPEKLTFIEQTQVFTHAKIIIGSSGAAMANLIFAAADTKIYILISRHPEMIYWYWQNIGWASGKTIRYMLGPAIDNKMGIHSDFEVSLDEIYNELKDKL